MKQLSSITILFFLMMLNLPVFAQKESYDLVTYTAPDKWKKDTKENLVVFSKVDNAKGTWCQLSIVKSTISKGTIESDFESEWKQLAEDPYKSGKPAQELPVQEEDGWKTKSGVGKFVFNNADALVMVTTISGYERCISFVATTNTDQYMDEVQKFLESVEMVKPALSNNIESNTQKDTKPASGAVKDGYAFNTTNFDDGWTSIIKEDWVETTKGNVKVLLHYPKEGTVFPADPAPLTNAAWNILVAPRYGNLKNYRTTYISAYNRPTIGMGYATENATGKNVFVLLFRQSEGWIEFVTPDKESFIEQFKIDPETIDWNSNSDVVNPLAAMKGYNKFAVAASDINGTGKWNDHFASNTYYTNVYTGMSAGMSTYSSSQWFDFGAGNTYKWQLVAANSYGGVSKFAQAKGAGAFKMLNNWQIYFSDIEGKPKTYDVYFTANKGGRVLWMNDAEYKGSGIFTGYTKE